MAPDGVRPGTVDNGRVYENIIATFLLLELLSDDNNINDFRMLCNPAGFGSFDDIVLKITDGKINQKFALQLKHKDGDSKVLQKSSLEATNGDWSILKYYKDCLNLEKSLQDFKWILFSNIQYNLSDTQVKEIKFQNSTVTMNSCSEGILGKLWDEKHGRCYKFESESSEHQEFFKNFFLCTNQPDVSEMKRKGKDKCKQIFENEDLFSIIFNFITQWNQQKGIRRELDMKFTKQFIMLHLLSPYIQPIPLIDVEDVPPNPKSELLRQAIEKFRVTVCSEEIGDKITKIWKDVRKEFQNSDIKTVDKLFLETCNIDSDVENVEDLNDKQCCKIMWLMDKCPLIVKNNKYIKDAIDVFENKTFVVLSDSALQNLKVSMFQNLGDLRKFPNIYDDILREFKCSLPGKKLVNLGSLLSKNLQIVTPTHLVLMLEDKFVIGTQDELPFYMTRSLSRHIVSYEFLKQIDNSTVVFINSCDYSIKKIDELLRKKIEDYDGKINKSIWCSLNKFSRQKFIEKSKRFLNKKKFHQFLFTEDDKLEWIRSKNGIEDLQEFLVEDRVISEDECFSNEDNNINLVCADPGMGKSLLMQNFRYTKFPDFWTIIIQPKDHGDYFRQHGDDVYKFQEYILKKEITNSEDSFEFRLLKSFFNANRVVYVWDGLDEVLDETLKIVTRLISKISEKNVKQWITSRNNLKCKLEKSFNVLARTITPLTSDEQEEYIRRRLTCLEDVLKKIINKVKNGLHLVSNNNIFAIPLQIYMFTELLLKDPTKYDEILNNILTLDVLYKLFVDEKFDRHFVERRNIKIRNQIQRDEDEKIQRNLVRNYEQAAMVAHFPQNVLKDLNIDCVDFLESIKQDKDVYGLITRVSEKNLPSFLHISYSEYFAACYLEKQRTNRKCMAELSKIIFEERYKNIRFFFDSILARNCQAHRAVLHGDLTSLRSLQPNEINQRDLGGRTALHLACSHAQSYSNFKSKVKGTFRKKYVIQVSKTDIKKESKEILSYLLNVLDSKEKDNIFCLNSLKYADRSRCLLPLVVLLSRDRSRMKKIKSFNFSEILFYSVVTNLPEAFGIVNTLPVVRDQENYSLLKFAAENGSLGAFKRLLTDKMYKRKYEDPNIRKLLLFVAAENGHDKVATFLLENPLSVEFIYKTGTPLYVACKNGHLPVVKVLVKHRANINSSSIYNETPLYAASKKGHVEIVEYLIEKGVEVDTYNGNFKTPLFVASKKGHLVVVKTLLEARANVNIGNLYDDRTFTALDVAFEKEHHDIVNFLLDQGADFHDQHLKEACERGYGTVVSTLISNGARFDSSHLEMACIRGRNDVVEILLESGVEIEEKLLANTCKFGNFKVVELLIANGANINPENKNKSPLKIAYDEGYFKIVKLLIAEGANVDGYLHRVCKDGVAEILDELLLKTKDVDQVNRDGNTALFVSSMNGHLDIVKMLISLGANVNSKNNQERTPLYEACSNGHYDVAELLIQENAHVNAVCRDGDTPLYAACRYGRDKIVALLLSHKAIGIENALSIAEEKRHTKIMKLLTSRRVLDDTSEA